MSLENMKPAAKKRYLKLPDDGVEQDAMMGDERNFFDEKEQAIEAFKKVKFRKGFKDFRLIYDYEQDKIFHINEKGETDFDNWAECLEYFTNWD